MPKAQKGAKAADAAQAAKPLDTSNATGAEQPGDQAKAALPPVAPPPKAEKPTKAALPAQVTMAGLYGFFDDEGSFHSWPEGHVVTDPVHIELLIARGAPLAE